MRNFCSIIFNYTLNKFVNEDIYTISAENQLLELAKSILEKNPNHRIFCLLGELGAGKTSLIQAFGSVLGVNDSIVSPTYSIINEYESEKATIYHMDLYRLNSIDEAYNIGIEDYLFSDNYVFIEWPDLINGIIPDHQIIKIEVLEDSTRKIVHLYNSIPEEG